jgi:hypothetical protein
MRWRGRLLETMQHNEFVIGKTFWCGGRLWRCTDIGTRVIIAIRLDRVDVEGSAPELRRILGRVEAEAEGWFNGPPYAVVESVFDEDYIPACSLEPDPEIAPTDNA